MKKLSVKKIPILRTYKDTITYICPVRGEVSEEREITVYGTIYDLDKDVELVPIDKILRNYSDTE